MKLSGLIKGLEHWMEMIGDREVQAIHSGYTGYHKIVDILLPMDRDMVVIVTQPVEWSIECDRNLENTTEKSSSQP